MRLYQCCLLFCSVIHVWSDSQAVIVYPETQGPDGLNNNNNIQLGFFWTERKSESEAKAQTTYLTWSASRKIASISSAWQIAVLLIPVLVVVHLHISDTSTQWLCVPANLTLTRAVLHWIAAVCAHTSGWHRYCIVWVVRARTLTQSTALYGLYVPALRHQYCVVWVVRARTLTPLLRRMGCTCRPYFDTNTVSYGLFVPAFLITLRCTGCSCQFF